MAGVDVGSRQEVRVRSAGGDAHKKEGGVRSLAIPYTASCSYLWPYCLLAVFSLPPDGIQIAVPAPFVLRSEEICQERLEHVEGFSYC